MTKMTILLIFLFAGYLQIIPFDKDLEKEPEKMEFILDLELEGMDPELAACFQRDEKRSKENVGAVMANQSTSLQKVASSVQELLWECPDCGSLVKYGTIVSHKKIHAGTIYQCGFCPLYKSERTHMLYHVEHMHCGIGRFICTLCANSDFFNHYGIALHLKNKHNITENKSDYYKKRVLQEDEQINLDQALAKIVHITDPEEIARIKKGASKQRKPKRTLADIVSEQQDDVQSVVPNVGTLMVEGNEDRAPEDLLWQCPICDTKIKYQFHKWHLKIHTGNLYKCPLCTMCNSKMDAVRYHITTLHCGIDPFVCKVCLKDIGQSKFFTASSVARHLKHDHGITKNKSDFYEKRVLPDDEQARLDSALGQIVEIVDPVQMEHAKSANVAEKGLRVDAAKKRRLEKKREQDQEMESI